MRNIFLFIRRYFNILFFLVLQVLCIYFIVSYSRFHHAAFGSLSNQLTGNINRRYNQVEQYFYLKRANDSLAKANERLYNLLRSNYDLPDTVSRSFVDSIRIDSLLQYQTIRYWNAKVVSNSVTTQNNFIVLNRGKQGGLKNGMGVVDPNRNVVGIITDLSGTYAVVMSLLHKDSRISGKLQKTGETGTVVWDGKEPNRVTLINIPKSAKIAKGDSVVTSGFSTTFPKGLLIGRVEGVYTDPSSNYYKLKLNTATNFYNLQYAYVIENKDQDSVNALLEKAKKQP